MALFSHLLNFCLKLAFFSVIALLYPATSSSSDKIVHFTEVQMFFTLAQAWLSFHLDYANLFKTFFFLPAVIAP